MCRSFDTRTHRRAIPERSRLGTRFVFRQGSPLNIMDLRDIAVAQAAAVIVLGDSARSAPAERSP